MVIDYKSGYNGCQYSAKTLLKALLTLNLDTLICILFTPWSCVALLPSTDLPPYK